MPIRLNSTGGGAVTITAPYTASTYTLTAPTVTANLVTDSANSITQSMMSTGLAGTGPAFGVYLSSDQTPTNTTWNKVQMNTKEFDTANCYDNTTNYRFTPNVAGYYQFSCSVGFYGSSTLVAYGPGIYKNGSLVKYQALNISAAAGATTLLEVTSLIYLNGSTDYIEFWAYINATGTIKFVGGNNITYASGFLARAA